MAQQIKKNNFEDSFGIHQLYIDILNCMPNIVYWVDNDCILKGCNNQFIQMLGLKEVGDLKGTPYEQMAKLTSWSNKRIESFRLDDMKVIFSGVAQYDVEESPIFNKKGEAVHYLSRRVPLFDNNHQVIGLVVVLTDVSERKKLEAQLSEQKSGQEHSKAEPVLVEEPHVLMVEDNFIAQKVEEALLTALHCHVDIADSGDKALKLFGPGKYDIVFMDIGLEDTSGYMVAKKFRQMEENTKFHVPIIALTSYQADVVKYDCNDYFMDGVLTKPLTSEQAKQIIQHFIYHENIDVAGLKSVK
ncbi:response regulator [Legionella oakridgensis]|uniref:CheY-like receiver n=2 Tax=Legionella oakridgensis TaxID=29423 RepID=W0BDA3_9GAMM|nr:response regulator [Legionella oakridgensis]AHE67830.1 CheY-like receiver [Legionella oakridgensis ATCC 33761 = DSM 21215]ETO92632.1 CheY-like receiver [Legionella oakridgensis RV-2-2007]KTD44074.1 sensory box sensor histidine kinase/response regulator [Legionella oakridgensis]STY20842.1 sensory box sensor histidine kinase/response regulator, putative [Legionella longbeachae]